MFLSHKLIPRGNMYFNDYRLFQPMNGSLLLHLSELCKMGITASTSLGYLQIE